MNYAVSNGLEAALVKHMRESFPPVLISTQNRLRIKETFTKELAVLRKDGEHGAWLTFMETKAVDAAVQVFMSRLLTRALEENESVMDVLLQALLPDVLDNGIIQGSINQFLGAEVLIPVGTGTVSDILSIVIEVAFKIETRPVQAIQVPQSPQPPKTQKPRSIVLGDRHGSVRVDGKLVTKTITTLIHYDKTEASYKKHGNPTLKLVTSVPILDGVVTYNKVLCAVQSSNQWPNILTFSGNEIFGCTSTRIPFVDLQRVFGMGLWETAMASKAPRLFHSASASNLRRWGKSWMDSPQEICVEECVHGAYGKRSLNGFRPYAESIRHISVLKGRQQQVTDEESYKLALLVALLCDCPTGKFTTIRITRTLPTKADREWWEKLAQNENEDNDLW